MYNSTYKHVIKNKQTCTSAFFESQQPSVQTEGKKHIFKYCADGKIACNKIRRKYKRCGKYYGLINMMEINFNKRLFHFLRVYIYVGFR